MGVELIHVDLCIKNCLNNITLYFLLLNVNVCFWCGLHTIMRTTTNRFDKNAE